MRLMQPSRRSPQTRFCGHCVVFLMIKRGRTRKRYGRPGAGYLGYRSHVSYFWEYASLSFQYPGRLWEYTDRTSVRSYVTAWHTFCRIASSQSRWKARHIWPDSCPSSLRSRSNYFPWCARLAELRPICVEVCAGGRGRCHRQRSPLLSYAQLGAAVVRRGNAARSYRRFPPSGCTRG